MSRLRRLTAADGTREARIARLITVVVFLAIVGWYVAFAVQRYETSHLYGDEPEYVFAGESVWSDGDLDLRDEFLHPDPHAFPGPLVFKVDPAGGPAPANFMPTNGVLLLEPADAAGGLLLVYLLSVAMNVASLLLLFIVLRRTFTEVVSALAVGVAGLTVPLAWHAASVWTEVPALLCVCAVLALAPRIACSAGGAAGTGLLLGVLPWLHQKYLLLALGLAVAVLLPAARRRFWPLVLGIPVVAFIGTVAFSYALRDRWNFTVSGTTDDVSSAFDGSVNRFLRQPIAWFLDDTRGWLPLAPVWVLAGVGLLFLLRFRRGRRLLATLAVAFVPFFLLYFWGPFLAGDSPPARETIPAIPALTILLAAGISALRGVLATTVAAVLGAVSVAVATVGPFHYGFDVMFNNVGRPKLLDAIATARFTPAELFPRITAEPGTWSLSALLLSGIAVLALIGLLHQSSRLVAVTGGRPWLLAGEEASRPTRAGLAATLRAGRPRRRPRARPAGDGPAP